jgi:hypothetical protein
MTTHYISNKDLLEEVIKYRKAYYEAKNAGAELPQI